MEKLLLSCQNALIFRLTLAVLLGGAGLGANADFDEGAAAYERGDYAAALREWQPLAEQGDAPAQFNLGLMHAEGKGVPRDDRMAVQWHRRAAEQGDVSAQNSLGLMYAKGRGVPRDYKMAAQWYRRAAEQGDASAQNSLSVMYTIGAGVPKDYVHAHMWANIAASGGEKTLKLRNDLAKLMTPSQIAEAERLARKCVRKAYKDC